MAYRQELPDLPTATRRVFSLSFAVTFMLFACPVHAGSGHALAHDTLLAVVHLYTCGAGPRSQTKHA